MKKDFITKDMTIMEVIDKKPEAIEVLMEFGLGCFSCAFSGMETIEQGALGHGMSEKIIEKMVEEINKF
ncbi:MAG: DUF1858 domain-containing protein [Nanoarchaeota archaeon]|nr:DUF1858 domain-containing protein [Nanoarchaeota archaeon]